MMEKIWGIIDAQSLPNAIYYLESEKYERLFFFHLEKAHIPKIEIPLLKEKLTFIPCKGKQKHALNIQMAYRLGFLDAIAPEELIFHFFSQDKGFDTLLSELSHKAERLGGKPSGDTFDAKVLKVFDILNTRTNGSRTRPKIKHKLINFISNSTKEPSISEAILADLIKHEYIKIDEKSSVSYLDVKQSLIILKAIENLRSIHFEKRPSKYPSLVNHLLTFFKSQNIGIDIKVMLKELSEREILLMDKGNIIYYI